jgi:hypothetical protein
MNDLQRAFSFALILVACATFIHAQNARVDGVVQSRTGAPAPGAFVAVCTQPANTTVIPCTPMAPICSSTGDATCLQPNPIQADGLGNYSFYILPGTYTLQIYGSGLTTRVQPDQGFGLAGTATLPIYLNAGTPTSQTNECASVTTNTSLSGAVTAVAALRTIGTGNVGHDVLCVVTSDAGSAGAIGGLVFPYNASFSTTADLTTGNGGLLASTGTGNTRTIYTNTSGTTRTNSQLFRSCVGGCGTDFRQIEDIAGVGNEDMTWIGPSQAGLYVTFNCPAGCATTFANTNGTHQFLLDDGSHDAKTNPEFGLVNGHLAHGTTGSNATDTWNTTTCAANTKTITFTTAFSNTNYVALLTDQTTAGGARVSTKNTGSMVITCTGATDVVDYLVLGNPF